MTKWLSKEKIDEIDYKDYVASSNSSDEQSEDEEEIVWKRALLGLDKESSNESSDEDINRVIGVAKRKQKVNDEGKDIVIKFTSGLEDIAEKVKEKHEKEELEKTESAWEKYNWEKKEKWREMKKERKEKQLKSKV